MPSLIAPDDLLQLATPLWQRLAPAWTVELLRVPASWLGAGNFGLTVANTTTSEAAILIADDVQGVELSKTLGHEMSHVNAWPATEILDHSDPRTVALIEPIIERFGLAAVAGGLARSRRFAAGLAREGTCMDDIALILAALRAALTSTDVAGAVQALIDEISGMMPADALAIEDPAPVAGEAMPAMMRRLFPAALARRIKPAPVATLTDTGFSGKVLARLGVTTEGEALLRIAALKIADSQVADLATESDTAARKALALDTMKRTGLARSAFFVDGKDELLAEWLEGDVDALGRTFAALKRGGKPLARAPITPAPVVTDEPEISAEVRAYATRKGKGGDEKYMLRLARELRNGGSLPQES